jgi:hypothetical protein
MSQWWAIPMLLSGGLFVGGVALIAWERVPAWRVTDVVDFRTGSRTRCDAWTACSRHCWSSALARPSPLPAVRVALRAPSSRWLASSWPSSPPSCEDADNHRVRDGLEGGLVVAAQGD